MTSPATELEALVARSRLLGADASFVVHGGGNTSSKGVLPDHLGRVREVLWVKGSGADLATAGAADYPALWLEEVRELGRFESLSDERMTELLRTALVDPGARRPSIETLLHAFVPHRHVDHVHADAVVTLTKAPDPAATVAAALGPRVGYVEWIRPGFELARRVGAMAGLEAVVLGHHGLVTWADEAEACAGRTREVVERADAYLRDELGAEPPSTSGNVPDGLGAEELDELLLHVRRSRLGQEPEGARGRPSSTCGRRPAGPGIGRAGGCGHRRPHAAHQAVGRRPPRCW